MTELNLRLASLSPEKRALLLQQLSKQTAAAPKHEIGRRSRPNRIPLSFAQQRFWILDQLEPGSAAYNVPLSLWMHGQLDGDVLQRALSEIARRHESLRTVVVADDAGPHQIVQSPAPVPVERQDLRHLPPTERHEAALTLARREAARPFDIAHGPLLRALLAQVADDAHLFVLNAHHIAVDGWSLSIVLDELRQLYAAFRSERPSPLAELPLQLVGSFVNTLALRNDLSGNPTFRELLARVKDVTLGAYSHQDLPIEGLLAELDLDRSLSHSPLFQVMVFFQNFPSEEIHLSELTLTPVDFDAINSGTARSDLALFASENDGALAMFFEYATDLFDEATVAAFSQHLQQLLRSVVADPSQRLGELAILSPEERHRLLIEWNDTRLDTPIDRPLHALFEAQAARSPDAVAVEHANAQLTYAELDAQADALAQMLVERGAGPGELVGLFVERSPRMLVALLAVLKAGAAYVPLDPSYPAERLAFMLEDSAARWVLTERSLLAQLPTYGGEAVLVENGVASPRGTRVASDVSPEDLAYVIFTSGSTGRPKGVQVPHRAAVNFLAAVAREPGLTASDTVCAVTTLSFDIALLELLLPLTVGARIALADRTTASDGVALARLIESSGSTVMQATPATWRLLLEAGWQGQPRLRILSGGEALPRDLADRLLGCGREVWNLYGPTETTVWSTVERVTAGDEPISIGRPLANTEIYVVDQRLQPVPAGVPGELLIGGLGVARGYLARPELTAEKFIADTLGPRPGGRLYRTGDLARWRRDGRLEVLGRIDHQVKLRGFRIELGEIESVLGEHPAVRQAVVICREDRPGHKRLVAYVVAQSTDTPTSAELRAFVKERLPEYMVPSACVLLECLPLTPNGKADRSALPAPEAAPTETATFAAPRNSEEETLAQLWAEVLGVERVGIHDDFFDLGGHSLLATQLITRMQKAFGGELGLRTLFEAPTVAGFAELLIRQRMESVGADALADMLDQLEGLTDAQIQALLACESPAG